MENNREKLPASGFASPRVEDILFGGPVRECLGRTDYKALGQRDASWRRVALGLTLPANRNIVAKYPWSYNLSQAIGMSRQPLSDRAILGIGLPEDFHTYAVVRSRRSRRTARNEDLR